MIINIADRLQSAFGYVATKKSKALDVVNLPKDPYDGLSTLDFYVANQNATFDEITLTHNNKRYLFAYRSLSEEYSNIFAPPPMIDLSRKKNLIITQIDGVNDVDVVERYNTSPYQIGLKGVLIDMENHQFPISKLQEINDIFEVNQPFDVSCEILRSVNVYALYIKDIALNFVQGFEDTIAYSINASAIMPYAYQLKN
jgi:hypothetical protein